MAMSRGVISSRSPFPPIRLQLRQRTVNVEAPLNTGFDGAIVCRQWRLYR